jgi:acyl carrier protein
VSPFRDLKLILDWPRTRQLVAKHLGKREDEMQAMLDNGDSLGRVELVMAIEEVLGIPIGRFPQS